MSYLNVLTRPLCHPGPGTQFLSGQKSQHNSAWEPTYAGTGLRRQCWWEMAAVRPWKKPGGSLFWDGWRTQGAKIISHHEKEVKTTFLIQLVSAGIQPLFRHWNWWNCTRNLLCSLGGEQTDVTYLSPEYSNEGHANTITYLESFGVSLEKDNEINSKDSTDCTFEWRLFTFVPLNKNHQGKKYNDHCQSEIPKSCLIRSWVVQPEKEKSELERTNPIKGVSQETCLALMESFQPTLDSNQRGILEEASQPSCVIIQLSFFHPDRAETGENDEDFIALCGKQLITLWGYRSGLHCRAGIIHNKIWLFIYHSDT